MAIQEIEIGIPIDSSLGEFTKTVFKDGKLQLIELGRDINNNPIYEKYGEWTSEPIKLKDKFKSFKHLVKTMTGTNGEFKIFTQSSLDSYMWTEWQEINYETGNILSPLGLFARVKIEITAKENESEVVIDTFKDVEKFDNKFIDNTNGYLELKKKYEFEMNKNDVSQGNYENHIYIKTVPNTKFKKIDKINIKENINSMDGR